jgi:hypothetical protein
MLLAGRESVHCIWIAAHRGCSRGAFSRKGSRAASLVEETRRAGCDANEVRVTEELEAGRPRPHRAPDVALSEQETQKGELENSPGARGSVIDVCAT